MIRENQRLLNQLHILTDGLMVFLAMLVSYWLRFGLFRGEQALPLSHYAWLGLGAAVLTALNLADDLMRAQDEVNRLRRELALLRERR